MIYLYYGFEVIATFFESFVIIETISRLFSWKKTFIIPTLLKWLSIILVGSITVLCNYFGPHYRDILDLGVVAIYIMFSLFLFEGNKFFKLIVPIILTILIMVINISVNILMSQIYGVSSDYLIEPGSNLRLLGLFVTKVSFFLSTLLFVKKCKKNNYLLKMDEWFGMVIIFFISVGILFTVGEIQYKHTDKNINMPLLIVGILVINICVFFFFDRITKKNKDLTKLQLSNMHFSENLKALKSIELMYNEMKIMKHDMKNEWIVVHDAFQKGDNMRTKELLNGMLNKIDDVFEETISLSEPSINAIINYKFNCAKQCGIHCTSIIQDDFSNFDEYDIVMLISNLLDNAIEASKDSEKPRLDMTITIKMNYLNIVISNTIMESVLARNAQLNTSKKEKEKHGFGIQSVRQIVEKYNGMIDFYEQDTMFYVDILLKRATPVLRS